MNDSMSPGHAMHSTQYELQTSGLPNLPAHVFEVADALTQRFADFDHYNLSDPLEELLFILCSLQTDETKYRAIYRSLRQVFPQLEDLEIADVGQIAHVLAGGGLARQKAAHIKAALATIRDRFGKLTLSPLQNMRDRECEKFLMSLSGVGKKSARCIMLYALRRSVFPVDTHCWRVCCRLGWATPTRPDGSCSPADMDYLQHRIPQALRFSLHVNLVSLGRAVCTVRNPKCSVCPVSSWCPRIGVAQNLLDGMASPSISADKTVWPGLMRRRSVLEEVSDVMRVGQRRSPQVWWVNQSTTYLISKAAGCIWAPVTTHTNRPVWHWDTLALVRPGDVIVHCSKPNVVALGRATTNAYEAPIPLKLPNSPWTHLNGRRVDVEYTELKPPIRLVSVASKLAELGIPHGPLNKNGHLKQAYLVPFTFEGIAILKHAYHGTLPNWTEETSYRPQ